MSKFNGRKEAQFNIVRNNEGEKVYDSSALKSLFMQVLGSFFAQNTFYKTRYAENEFRALVELIDSIENKDKEYALKVAELGRYTGMIDYPLNVLTACYNMDKFKGENFLNADGVSKFEYYSDKIVRRTKDVNYILATQNTMYGTDKLPKQMRKNLKGKLEFFDKYKLSKGLDIGKKVSLADSIKRLHPQPKNEDMAQFLKDVLEGKVKVGNDKKQIQAEITNIKRAEKEKKEVNMEELKANLVNAMYKSNLSALLKNLMMLYKYEILNDEKHLDFVCSKITDRNSIVASKIMPYQVYALHKVMQHLPSTTIVERIREALETAVETAIENVPKIEGYTAFLLDVSWSMHNSKLSNNSNISLKEMACLLGAIAYKKGQGDMFIFSNECERISVSRKTPIFEIVEKAVNSMEANGTYLDLALTEVERFAKEHHIKYDNLLLLSDNDCYCYDSDVMELSIGSRWEKRTPLDRRCNQMMDKENGIFDTIWINNLSGERFTVFNTDDNKKNLITGYSEKFIEVLNLYYNVRNNRDIRPLIDALLEKYRGQQK